MTLCNKIKHFLIETTAKEYLKKFTLKERWVKINVSQETDYERKNCNIWKALEMRGF